MKPASVAPGANVAAEKQLRSRLRQLTKERQSLRQSEALWGASFRHSPIALCIVGAGDGTVRDVNDLFCQLTGYDRAELVGAPIAKLFAAGEANPFDHLQSFTADSVGEMPANYVAHSGDSRTAVWALQVIDVNHEQCAVAAVMDLSEWKKRELALSREAAGLAERVSALETENAQHLEHKQRLIAQVGDLLEQANQLKLDAAKLRQTQEELTMEIRRLREHASGLMAKHQAPKPAVSALRRLTALLSIDRRSLAAAAASHEPAAETVVEPHAAVSAAEPAPAPVALATAAIDAPQSVPEAAAPAPVAEAETPLARLSVGEAQLLNHIAALRHMAERIESEIGVAAAHN